MEFVVKEVLLCGRRWLDEECEARRRGMVERRSLMEEAGTLVKDGRSEHEQLAGRHEEYDPEARGD